jgi:hypothetical protein
LGKFRSFTGRKAHQAWLVYFKKKATKFAALSSTQKYSDRKKINYLSTVLVRFIGSEKELGFLKDWGLLVFLDWIKSVSGTKVRKIQFQEECFRLNNSLFR